MFGIQVGLVIIFCFYLYCMFIWVWESGEVDKDLEEIMYGVVEFMVKVWISVLDVFFRQEIQFWFLLFFVIVCTLLI